MPKRIDRDYVWDLIEKVNKFKAIKQFGDQTLSELGGRFHSKHVGIFTALLDLDEVAYKRADPKDAFEVAIRDEVREALERKEHV